METPRREFHGRSTTPVLKSGHHSVSGEATVTYEREQGSVCVTQEITDVHDPPTRSTKFKRFS